MSASLVGSEMCIRDRFIVACSDTVGCKQCLPRPGTLPCRKAPQQSLGAVSYTHLTLPTICSV
eukprot:1893192-Alexandrium_andersonii.AAC.1